MASWGRPRVPLAGGWVGCCVTAGRQGSSVRPQAPLIRAMRWYIQHFPIARGKGPMLALLRRCLPAGLFPAPLHDNMRLLLRRDDMVAFLTFVRQVWEPENTTIVRSLLQAGDAFVDVGANAGYFTVLAGLLVGPSGEVLALEPMPETHEWLAQNVRLNDLDNVTLLAAAAADHEDGLELQFFAGETRRMPRSSPSGGRLCERCGCRPSGWTACYHGCRRSAR
jgi:hypothetical protein